MRFNNFGDADMSMSIGERKIILRVISSISLLSGAVRILQVKTKNEDQEDLKRLLDDLTQKLEEVVGLMETEWR